MRANPPDLVVLQTISSPPPSPSPHSRGRRLACRTPLRAASRAHVPSRRVQGRMPPPRALPPRAPACWAAACAASHCMRAHMWRVRRGWCFRHVQVVRYSGKTSAARPELASPREDDDEGNGTRSSPPARGRGGSCSIHGPQSRQLAPRRPMTEAARLSGNSRPPARRAHTCTARPGGDGGGFHPS